MSLLGKVHESAIMKNWLYRLPLMTNILVVNRKDGSLS